MEDRSIIKPILNALDYFQESNEEINFFYNVIDQFCAHWFNKTIKVSDFNHMDYLLIHELLGEYLRFEENNKRIALWLLAINRVCYNYNNDLSQSFEQLQKIKASKKDDIDSTLIEPILNQLDTIEKIHEKSGKLDRGQSDLISNFLQWVMVYTTFIYPSLDNKMNFNDKVIIKAMNFILIEFIKQRSNDKRMAFLIMAIMEACKQYSIQHSDNYNDFIKQYQDDTQTVLAGKDEEFVKEILNRLKAENQKNQQNHVEIVEVPPESFINEYMEKLSQLLNNNSSSSFSLLKTFSLKFSNKYRELNEQQKFLLLQAIQKYKSPFPDETTVDIKDQINKSIELLSLKTKQWIKNELAIYNKQKDKYINLVIKQIEENKKNTHLYLLILLLKRYEIY